MEHPNIAKVFDAGATSTGRPYFVMEYVPGIPITAYCDKHCLAIRERLGLFMQVCEGVQHAHQKAIIRRDLKPFNVLVEELDQKPGIRGDRRKKMLAWVTSGRRDIERTFSAGVPPSYS